MAKILIVEDDRTLCGTIESWLKADNHRIDVAFTFGDGEHFLDVYRYDAVILDVALPDGSGLDLLTRFRKKGGKTPVLMLTGRSKLEHKEEGFGAGADDYLTKPFNIKEMGLRVTALLRRGEPPDDALLFGDICLDGKKREVTKAGALLDLYPQEFDLLEFLMKHPDEVVRSQVVISHVWGSDAADVTQEALRTLVARVRKKLGETGDKSVIETVHGIGLRLRL